MENGTYQILVGQIRIAIWIRCVDCQGDAVREYSHKNKPLERSAKVASRRDLAKENRNKRDNAPSTIDRRPLWENFPATFFSPDLRRQPQIRYASVETSRRALGEHSDTKRERSGKRWKTSGRVAGFLRVKRRTVGLFHGRRNERTWTKKTKVSPRGSTEGNFLVIVFSVPNRRHRRRTRFT